MSVVTQHNVNVRLFIDLSINVMRDAMLDLQTAEVITSYRTVCGICWVLLIRPTNDLFRYPHDCDVGIFNL